ncbi:MAG: hypothetical protein NXY57DRAFT_416911 [Lentinula lateritia]|nr:MAG: hypothetical protein NXY57DRAFT_416911 [Lentinula lateritia]
MAFIRVTATLLAWFTSYPVCLTVQAATTTTTTVDDADSSAFTFVSAWNAITPSDPCDGCATKLDSTQVLDGTWHDGSVAGSTASFKFEGSGVTLYGVTNADQTCALTFVLDGGSPVNLDLSSIPQSPTKVYNYQFFSASGLSSGSHTLSWTIETSVSNAVALIDYAIVTSDVASSSTSTTSSSSLESGQSQTGTSSSSTSQVSSFPSSTQTNPISGTSLSTSSNLSPTTTNGPSPTATNTSTSSFITSNSGSTVLSSIILITIGTSVETSTMISQPSPTTSGQVSTNTSAAIPASQKSKLAAATIVGAVLGTVIGVALVAFIVFLLARRRRKSKQAPSSIPGLESFRFDHINCR